MVLGSVLGGLVTRLVAGPVVTRILPALPWVSVAGISLVVIAVVSGSTEQIVSAGALVLLAVVRHNGLGYLLGFWFEIGRASCRGGGGRAGGAAWEWQGPHWRALG